MERSGFRLGRAAGIEIRADWSVLVVLGLVTWSLAGSLLPDAAPGQSVAVYWSVGAATSVCFFATLLLHELSHSIVATRSGVVVERIVLWLFGGVSSFGSEVPTATTELRIALAGPAASVAIGALSWGVALLLAALGAADVVVAAVGWLGGMNLVLAVFNMLPAFPLDGGRVLRAWLWRRRGDGTAEGTAEGKMSATRTAAAVGRAFAFGLMTLGVLELLVGGQVSGLWLVFLGWFLLGAVAAEAGAVVVDSELSGVTVRDVMSACPVTVPSGTDLASFVEWWVYANRCSVFPVVDRSGAVVGLAGLSGVKRVDPASWTTTTVDRIAGHGDEIATATPGEPLAPAVMRMNATHQQRLLVFDGDDLVGIVSPSDVARALARVEAGRARGPLSGRPGSPLGATGGPRGG